MCLVLLHNSLLHITDRNSHAFAFCIVLQFVIRNEYIVYKNVCLLCATVVPQINRVSALILVLEEIHGFSVMKYEKVNIIGGKIQIQILQNINRQKQFPTNKTVPHKRQTFL